MLDTVIVAAVVTALNLVVGTTAGYAYARYRSPLKGVSLQRSASTARRSRALHLSPRCWAPRSGDRFPP